MHRKHSQAIYNRKVQKTIKTTKTVKEYACNRRHDGKAANDVNIRKMMQKANASARKHGSVIPQNAPIIRQRNDNEVKRNTAPVKTL